MVVCAALMMSGVDGYDDVVVPCFRHGHGYEILHNLMKNDSYKQHVVEGFITNNGEFLDRSDALVHARNSGQLSSSVLAYKREHEETELYSEDLY